MKKIFRYNIKIAPPMFQPTTDDASYKYIGQPYEFMSI